MPEVMDFLRSSVQDGSRREATFGFWQTQDDSDQDDMTL